VTRVPDDVVASVDELIKAGAFESRSDAVRAGLVALVDQRRRAAIGHAIADGYRRIPQAGDDLAWTEAVGHAILAEESW
jgi:Arc/MetJ-type ribon-helix-helix transcriptional regulator